MAIDYVEEEIESHDVEVSKREKMEDAASAGVFVGVDMCVCMGA